MKASEYINAIIDNYLLQIIDDDVDDTITVTKSLCHEFSPGKKMEPFSCEWNIRSVEMDSDEEYDIGLDGLCCQDSVSVSIKYLNMKDATLTVSFKKGEEPKFSYIDNYLFYRQLTRLDRKRPHRFSNKATGTEAKNIANKSSPMIQKLIDAVVAGFQSWSSHNTEIDCVIDPISGLTTYHGLVAGSIGLDKSEKSYTSTSDDSPLNYIE